MVKLANMAESHDVAIAPNCPLGPIALAASIQVDTVVPNLLVQDQGSTSTLRRPVPHTIC